MISVENISKTFGGQAALLPTTLTFQTRATTVLIGPSGCGDTALNFLSFRVQAKSYNTVTHFHE